jgi:hypothetical protein
MSGKAMIETTIKAREEMAKLARLYSIRDVATLVTASPGKVRLRMAEHGIKGTPVGNALVVGQKDLDRLVAIFKAEESGRLARSA